MLNAMKSAAIGACAGAAISAAIFLPLLVSIEKAEPNGFNVYFGDYGYHFETTE